MCVYVLYIMSVLRVKCHTEVDIKVTRTCDERASGELDIKLILQIEF